MKKDNKVIGLFISLIAMSVFTASAIHGMEVKIALDCPPDLEKCGTYVWSHAFSSHLQANGIKFKLYPADALGGEAEKLDQVTQGLLEVSNSDLAKVAQIDAFINGFVLPYLWDSIEHLDRVLAKTDLFQTVNARATKKGVRILAPITIGGFYGILNTKRPISSPDDLKGLRIRALSKDQALYLEAWGANSVIIPWPEIYSALQTGVADGYLNSAIVPIMFKHTEVVKFFTDARAIAPFRVAIASNKWYSGLSAKERSIVDEAVAKANAANRVWLARAEKSSLETLKAEGVTVTTLTQTQRNRFAELSRPVYTRVLPDEVVKHFVTAAEQYR